MKNPITSRLRHVNMRYHRIRQAIRDGSVEVRQLASVDMLADLFTKNFTAADFCRLRELCLGYGSKPNLPQDLKTRLQGRT